MFRFLTPFMHRLESQFAGRTACPGQFQPAVVRRCLAATAVVSALLASTATQANKVVLSESFADGRTFFTDMQVSTQGKILTNRAGGERDELEMVSSARFRFRSRRLPPAGRDASALREAREIAAAQSTTTVGDFNTQAQLSSDRSLIVVEGDREGIVSYSPQGPLTRDAVDLLEIPGNPLAILALLPSSKIEPGNEWTPPDWAAQMLVRIEAVESSELKCRLEQSTPAFAQITFSGTIKGQKLGSNATVSVEGGMLFDLANQFLSQAKATYEIQAETGTVNPGLDMTMTSTLSRKLDSSGGLLTEERVSSLPLELPRKN